MAYDHCIREKSKIELILFKKYSEKTYVIVK